MVRLCFVLSIYGDRTFCVKSWFCFGVVGLVLLKGPGSHPGAPRTAGAGGSAAAEIAEELRLKESTVWNYLADALDAGRA